VFKLAPIKDNAGFFGVVSGTFHDELTPGVVPEADKVRIAYVVFVLVFCTHAVLVDLDAGPRDGYRLAVLL
jgi:hypothetical protein